MIYSDLNILNSWLKNFKILYDEFQKIADMVVFVKLIQSNHLIIKGLGIKLTKK